MAINWNKRFMGMATEIGKWSSCYKATQNSVAAVGAVIVKGKRIIATGYNGAPSGFESCLDRGCCNKAKMGIEHGDNFCYAIHAEQNAILQAAKFGIAIEDCVMYCTTQPCPICTKFIINSGIKKVYYRNDYPNDWRDTLLKESKVEYIKYKDEE